MITFSNGLVLRRGARTLQFERQLDEFRVQFRYLDNNEVCTFTLGKLYTDILNKKFEQVFQGGVLIRPREDRPGEHVAEDFKLQLDHEQTLQLEFRLRMVKAALKAKVTHGSREKCRAFLLAYSKMLHSERDANYQKWLIDRDDAQFRLMKGFRIPQPSTLGNWIAKYQSSGGNPYSLMDRRPHSRRPKRLLGCAEELINQCISKHYLQLRGASAAETYRRLRTEIASRNRTAQEKICLPSIRTILRRVNEIDPYVRDFKRLGPTFARNNWRYSLKGDQSSRILERVEVDHTWLDVWVLDSKSGIPIGRPWITVLIDRLSGYPLGLFISFYGPSVSSVAQALKQSIFPKDDILLAFPSITKKWTAMGVAEMYVLDNGMEFHSFAFKQLAWELHADLIYNPVRRPWLKASIERAMMEFNRMLPNRGKVHTPIKNMIPQDPAESAAILFHDLVECVTAWAAEVFPYAIHPKNLVRPVDVWEEERLASPLPIFPTDMDRFNIASGIPATRTIGGDGVFFNYLRYNSVELQEYRRSHGETFRTEIRFNPDDLARMHVQLPKANRWIQVEMQRPSLEYGDSLSLIQHELIRKEAGVKLTRMNADAELQAARERMNERWGDAISRGVKVRKDADLIRMQGLTSAKVVKDRVHPTASDKSAEAPVAAQASAGILEKVVPYASFSLEEELQ